jgi:hypothetical protein
VDPRSRPKAGYTRSSGIGEDEFIAGSAPTIAEQIIEQCRAADAGNFAAIFDCARSPEALKEWRADV